MHRWLVEYGAQPLRFWFLLYMRLIPRRIKSPPRKTLLLLNRMCNNTLDGIQTPPWISQNPLNTLILLRIPELTPPTEKKTYKTETDFEQSENQVSGRPMLCNYSVPAVRRVFLLRECDRRRTAGIFRFSETPSAFACIAPVKP